MNSNVKQRDHKAIRMSPLSSKDETPQMHALVQRGDNFVPMDNGVDGVKEIDEGEKGPLLLLSGLELLPAREQGGGRE